MEPARSEREAAYFRPPAPGHTQPQRRRLRVQAQGWLHRRSTPGGAVGIIVSPAAAGPHDPANIETAEAELCRELAYGRSRQVPAANLPLDCSRYADHWI